MRMGRYRKYRVYKRGQIVLVNFKPQVGTEFSLTHLAIVLSKNDTELGTKITVVPLSSKYHPEYLDLGEFLYSEIQPQLKNLRSMVAKGLTRFKLGDKKSMRAAEFQNFIADLTELYDIVQIYKSKNKTTYAVMNNITTISKKRIIPYKNKRDPLYTLIVSDQIMSLIDASLIQNFTNAR